ncbi:MAG: hypothetical protein AMXMBFR64_00760 [Myxococcales bacterium]
MNWLLVVHLLGVIFWMGSLLILSRMLGYHVKEELAVQTRLSAIERRLYFGALLPGLVLALGTGTWMLIDDPALLKNPGFHMKLTLVVVGIAAQLVMQRFMGSLRDEPRKEGGARYKIVHAVLGLVLVGVLVSVLVVSRNWKVKQAAAATEGYLKAVQQSSE